MNGRSLMSPEFSNLDRSVVQSKRASPMPGRHCTEMGRLASIREKEEYLMNFGEISSSSDGISQQVIEEVHNKGRFS